MIFWRKSYAKKNEEKDAYDHVPIDGEFGKGVGPKRFTYRELSRATNNFAKEIS